MIISAIVAVSDNEVIGKKGGVPWYLPAELARFKEVTIGHPIIMGRKTHESIGRTLPGRLNVVITHNPKYKAMEGAVVVGSLSAALNHKEVKKTKEVFVIGGAEIYSQAMDRFDRLYLTKVHATIDGDKFFKYNPGEWKQTYSQKHKADDKNQYDFEFTVLQRKN